MEIKNIELATKILVECQGYPEKLRAGNAFWIVGAVGWLVLILSGHPLLSLAGLVVELIGLGRNFYLLRQWRKKINEVKKLQNNG